MPHRSLQVASTPSLATARSLDRTMRLMRDDLHASVTGDELLAALRAPKVIIAADAANLRSEAAHTAVITTAMLLMRSGVSVALSIADVPMLGAQPPLTGERLVPSLLAVGDDLIADVGCTVDTPRQADIVIVIGDTPWRGSEKMVLRLAAGPFGAHLSGGPAASVNTGTRWNSALRFPLGALAAAGLAAGEVYKYSMRSLARAALTPTCFTERFAPSNEVQIMLDRTGTISGEELNALRSLGAIDMVSGGAISQAVLFALTRLPGAHGDVRVIEPEASEETNLNRYALLRRSMLMTSKAESLAHMALGGIQVSAVVSRYDEATPAKLGGLADSVVVGVDHIPTRWAVQAAHPQWLGIGATSHYSAMSSEHTAHTPCAWCLHPTDAPDMAIIPTVAFVSHWAGLLLACRLVRHRLKRVSVPRAQYDYFTALRPDRRAALWRSPVARRTECPNGCGVKRQTA